VRALATDNPHLPASYLEELRGLPPKLRRAWLEGDWGVFEGQVFEEWRDDLHVIDADFQPPATWRWGAGLDWGHREPGWFGLFACGTDGEIVCMAEYYFRQLHPREAGRQCALMAREHTRGATLEYVAADSAMWAQTGGPTLAEEFQHGWHAVYGGPGRGPPLLQTTKGAGSRVVRVQMLHRALAYQQDNHGVPLPGSQPRLRFLRRCRHAIRTIPALPYSKEHPEDVDTHAEDHPYDGVTYFLMSRAELVLKPHAWEQPKSTDVDTSPGFDWEIGEKRRRQFLGEEEEAPRGWRNSRELVRLDD
jgi:hypothetical protein